MSTLRVIRMILTLSCSKATALVSEGLDRRLSFSERIALGIHAAICTGCRRYQHQVQFLSLALSRLRRGDEMASLPLTASPALSPEARERIKEALQREGS